MATVFLSREEIDFLESQGLSSDDVFDTNGRSLKSCAGDAKALGKAVMIGSRCAKFGHRLRSRAGHCVMCRPANLGYGARYSKPAQVYIARSANLGLIKVGSSENSLDRQQHLNREALGGTRDWAMIFYAEVTEAGRLELKTHALLARYQSPLEYSKGNSIPQISRECFGCKPVVALNAIVEAAKAEGLDMRSYWTHPHFPWHST